LEDCEEEDSCGLVLYLKQSFGFQANGPPDPSPLQGRGEWILGRGDPGMIVGGARGGERKRVIKWKLAETEFGVLERKTCNVTVTDVCDHVTTHYTVAKLLLCTSTPACVPRVEGEHSSQCQKTVEKGKFRV
jgi:hypothetical protein